jgi:hypothetical protein
MTVLVWLPDTIKLWATEDPLAELERLDELELSELELEELEQLLALDELELELESTISKLLELLELELLEQDEDDTWGLNGVVRSPPQACNKIIAHTKHSAERMDFTVS